MRGDINQIINISETVSLSNIQLSYNIVRSKVDEVENIYVTQTVTESDRELDAKVISSNIRGVYIVPLDFLKTNLNPVYVELQDRYLKVRPEKTIIRDSEYRKYYDHRFDELQEIIRNVELSTAPHDINLSLDLADIENDLLIFEPGTIFRVVSGIKDVNEYVYYISQQGNNVCRIVDAKTTQVLLMERGLKSRDVLILEPHLLETFNINENCPSRVDEWIPRFASETGFGEIDLDIDPNAPTKPEEKVIKIEIVNTGSNGESCLPLCGGFSETPTETQPPTPTKAPTYPATAAGSLAKIKDKPGIVNRKGPLILAKCHSCEPDDTSSSGYTRHVTQYYELENWSVKPDQVYAYIGLRHDGKPPPDWDYNNMIPSILDSYVPDSPIEQGHTVKIQTADRFGRSTTKEYSNRGTHRPEYSKETEGIEYSYLDLAKMREAEDTQEIYVNYYDESKCLNIEGFIPKERGPVHPKPDYIEHVDIKVATAPPRDKVIEYKTRPPNFRSPPIIPPKEVTNIITPPPLSVVANPREYKYPTDVKVYYKNDTETVKALPNSSKGQSIETVGINNLSTETTLTGIESNTFYYPRGFINNKLRGSSGVNPTGGNTFGCFQCSNSLA